MQVFIICQATCAYIVWMSACICLYWNHWEVLLFYFVKCSFWLWCFEEYCVWQLWFTIIVSYFVVHLKAALVCSEGPMYVALWFKSVILKDCFEVMCLKCAVLCLFVSLPSTALKILLHQDALLCAGQRNIFFKDNHRKFNLLTEMNTCFNVCFYWTFKKHWYSWTDIFTWLQTKTVYCDVIIQQRWFIMDFVINYALFTCLCNKAENYFDNTLCHDN